MAQEDEVMFGLTGRQLGIGLFVLVILFQVGAVRGAYRRTFPRFRF